MIERVPPQNIEAEQAVLGAMLIKKEAIAEVSQLLKPADFYREAHRIVYETMLELFNKNEAVDLITVTDAHTPLKGGETIRIQPSRPLYFDAAGMRLA